MDQFVEGSGDGGVESVELAETSIESFVRRKWREDSAGQWGIELFEELQVDDADLVTRFRESVTAGLRDPLDKRRGASFGEVITQRPKRIFSGGEAKSFSGIGMDFGGGERVTSGDMGEADEGMHQRQLPGMVQLQARNPLAIGQCGGLAELA